MNRRRAGKSLLGRPSKGRAFLKLSLLVVRNGLSDRGGPYLTSVSHRKRNLLLDSFWSKCRRRSQKAGYYPERVAVVSATLFKLALKHHRSRQ